MRILALNAVLLGALVGPCVGAEVPKEPVPKSPYIAVVYRYADTMIEHGRDTFGPQKTGLFLSALDRDALAPLTSRPRAPTGVGEEARAALPAHPPVGANPQHDENLLRLLFTLSELSSKPVYRQAAEAELKWFLEHTGSPVTDLLPWGGGMAWDVIKDKPMAGDGSPGRHTFFRPWMLWDRCFEQAPEASRGFALGLWDHQIANHGTGAFDRTAGFSAHNASEGEDTASHAGFYIRTWAVAYAHTQEQRFLEAITILLQRYENRRHERTGLIRAADRRSLSANGRSRAAVASTLSLAIDCDGAAHRVPEPLASRLRAFAAREDGIFSALSHNVKETGGFATRAALETGAPQGSRTPLWDPRWGRRTTAQVAMMCVSRYDNSGHTGHRDLIHAAADAYLGSMPPADEDLWPGTLGQVISLQLAAWRSTARPEYLERARRFGDMAIERFFDMGPLPRASLKSDHYESITGADTLALALTELHLHVLHITAVRCPPNTIDR